jgi:hypothetical protein
VKTTVRIDTIDLMPPDDARVFDSSPAMLTEPAPCDMCPLAARCGAELLACSQFHQFTLGQGRARWSLAPRAPSHALFEAIFVEHDHPGGRPSVIAPGRLG